MDDCLFCRIAADPDNKVYEDHRVVAFNDINPQAPVHVLIVPRRHVASVADVDEPELLGAMFDAAVKIAQDRGIAESGFRTVFNSGPDALQTVFHLHLHLLGGRKFGWPPG